MKRQFVIIAVVALAIQGCATPHVVESKKISDNQLSCGEIVAQIDEAERFEKGAALL